MWTCCIAKTLFFLCRHDEELVRRLKSLQQMNVSFKRKNITSNYRPASSDYSSLSSLDAANNQQSAINIDQIFRNKNKLKRRSVETHNNTSSRENTSEEADQTPGNNQPLLDHGMWICLQLQISWFLDLFDDFKKK